MTGSMAGQVENGHGSIVLHALAGSRGTPTARHRGGTCRPGGERGAGPGDPLDGLAILRDNHGAGDPGLVGEADAEPDDAGALRHRGRRAGQLDLHPSGA